MSETPEQFDWCEVMGLPQEDASFSPLTVGGDDLRVMKRAHGWLYEDEDRYNVFWTHLSEACRSRDRYYDGTVNGYNLYYLGHYEVGDFARAAMAAVEAHPK